MSEGAIPPVEPQISAPTVAQELRLATKALAPLSETPALDAQSLLADLLGVPRAWLLAHSETALSMADQSAFGNGLERLLNGEPLPYVLGHWEFYGLDFLVTPDVLIPRPETELLVEQALDVLRRLPAPRLIADVGTGSGSIAVSLAHNAPSAQVVASDLSLAALRVASRNIARHKVQQHVWLVQADLLPALGEPVDVLCANLPYVPRAELAHLAVAAHEPRLALDGGESGFDVIARLLRQLAALRRPPRFILLEIGEQAEGALGMAREAFPSARIGLVPDLSGRQRVLRIQTLALGRQIQPIEGSPL